MCMKKGETGTHMMQIPQQVYLATWMPYSNYGLEILQAYSGVTRPILQRSPSKCKSTTANNISRAGRNPGVGVTSKNMSVRLVLCR